jgi:hypothetical protein
MHWAHSYDWAGFWTAAQRALDGIAQVRATAGRRASRRVRMSARVYGRNGARPCARRRRQIASGMLRGVRWLQG